MFKFDGYFRGIKVDDILVADVDNFIEGRSYMMRGQMKMHLNQWYFDKVSQIKDLNV